MKQIAGGLMLILGTVLLGWVAYNLFIERQPTTEGRSLITPVGFSGALLYVGFQWAFDKPPRQHKANRRSRKRQGNRGRSGRT